MKGMKLSNVNSHIAKRSCGLVHSTKLSAVKNVGKAKLASLKIPKK